MSKKTAFLGMLTVAIVLLLTTGSRADVTIYQDTFSRTGSLNGSSPDTTLGLYGGTLGATWAAYTTFGTDGSIVTNGPTSAAYLPFTPEAGHIYTLSADLNPNSTANWDAMGFATVNWSSPTVDNSWHTINNPSPWFLYRGGGGITYFEGPGTSGSSSDGGSTNGWVNFSIVLDTQTDVNNWTATLYVGGTQKGSIYTYPAASWTQNAIGIGDDGGDTLQADNFKLTVNAIAIPEPSTLALVGFGLLGAALVSRRSRKSC